MDSTRMEKAGGSKPRRDLTDPSFTPQLFQTQFILAPKWSLVVIKLTQKMVVKQMKSLQKIFVCFRSWLHAKCPIQESRIRYHDRSPLPVSSVMADAPRWREMEPVISRAQTPGAGLTPRICQNLLQNIEMTKIPPIEIFEWMTRNHPPPPLSTLAQPSQLSSNWTFNLQYPLVRSVTLASILKRFRKRLIPGWLWQR